MHACEFTAGIKAAHRLKIQMAFTVLLCTSTLNILWSRRMEDVQSSEGGKKRKNKRTLDISEEHFYHVCVHTHLPALNPACEALPQEKIELRSLTLHDTRQAPSIFIET